MICPRPIHKPLPTAYIPPTTDSMGRLSIRERMIMAMVGQGLTDAEIATFICRSPHTVHAHIKAIHLKLGTRSRTRLVLAAVAHGLAAPARPE